MRKNSILFYKPLHISEGTVASLVENQFDSEELVLTKGANLTFPMILSDSVITPSQTKRSKNTHPKFMNDAKFHQLQKDAIKNGAKSLKDLLDYYNAAADVPTTRMTLRSKLRKIEEKQILGRFYKCKQLFFFNVDYNKCRIFDKKINYYKQIFIIESISLEVDKVLYRVICSRQNIKDINLKYLHCFETVYVAKNILKINQNLWSDHQELFRFVSFPDLIKKLHTLIEKQKLDIYSYRTISTENLKKAISLLNTQEFSSVLEYFQILKREEETQFIDLAELLTLKVHRSSKTLEEKTNSLKLPPPIQLSLFNKAKKLLIQNNLSEAAGWLELHSQYQQNLSNGLTFEKNISQIQREKLQQIIIQRN